MTLKPKLLVALVGLGILLTGCTAVPVQSSENEIFPSEALDENVDDLASDLAEDGGNLEGALLIERRLAPPFQNPWPREFSRSELVESAQFRAFEFLEANSSQRCDHVSKVIFQDQSEIAAEISAIADSIVASFCADLAFDIYVVVGDYAFLTEQLARNQLRTDDFGGICGVEFVPSSMWGCALYETAWFDSRHPEESLRGLAAHEVFHLVQDSISPDPPSFRTPPGSPQRVPNWLTEGSASFIQAAIPDFLGTDDYVAFVKGSSSLRPGKKVGIDLSSLEEGWSSEVYSVGHFASEYLVANSSIDALMDVWRLRDKGMSFPDAFAQSFGIPLEEFYNVMEEIQLAEN